jgi:hypothetical protein
MNHLENIEDPQALQISFGSALPFAPEITFSGKEKKKVYSGLLKTHMQLDP